MSTTAIPSRIARQNLRFPRIELVLFTALVADAVVTAAGIYRFGTAIEANTILYPLWELSLANVELVQQPFGMDQMTNPLREEWFVAAAMFATAKIGLGAVGTVGVATARRIRAPYASYWAVGVTILVTVIVVRNLGVWV